MSAIAYGCSGDDSSTMQGSTSVLSDSGEPEGPVGGDAAQCQPADVSTFSAPAYRPALAQPGHCTPSQIDQFFQDCLAEGHTPATCAAFEGDDASASNQSCAACLISRPGDMSYGALVAHTSGLVSLNVPGCMELTNPASLDCAKAVQAQGACDDRACDANCATTVDLYGACSTEAAAGGCQKFTKAAACDASFFDAGAASICFNGLTFQDVYRDIALLFCAAREAGAPSPDAGRTADASFFPDATSAHDATSADDAASE